jgi:DNA-binding transcriptional regulator YiaG
MVTGHGNTGDASSVLLIRRSQGLTREAFAERYRLAVDLLRDWEEGVREPDDVTRTYLRVIRTQPDMVSEQLSRNLYEEHVQSCSGPRDADVRQ